MNDHATWDISPQSHLGPPPHGAHITCPKSNCIEGLGLGLGPTGCDSKVCPLSLSHDAWAEDEEEISLLTSCPAASLSPPPLPLPRKSCLTAHNNLSKAPILPCLSLIKPMLRCLPSALGITPKPPLPAFRVWLPWLLQPHFPLRLSRLSRQHHRFHLAALPDPGGMDLRSRKPCITDTPSGHSLSVAPAYRHFLSNRLFQKADETPPTAQQVAVVARSQTRYKRSALPVPMKKSWGMTLTSPIGLSQSVFRGQGRGARIMAGVGAAVTPS